jgi:hypothetical protein
VILGVVLLAALPAVAGDGDPIPWLPGPELIWGEVGYVGTLEHRKAWATPPGDSRWDTVQSTWASLNFRWDRYLELGVDVNMPVDGDDAWHADTVVKELYADLSPLDAVSFRVGRQRLKWGTGKVFHPIDKLEAPPDPFATRQVIEGIDGVKAEWVTSGQLSLSVLVLDEDPFSDTRYALRVDTMIGDVDLAVGLITYDHVHVRNRPSGAGAGFDLDLQSLERLAFFAETAGYIGQLGFYGELEVLESRDMEYAFADPGGGPGIVSDSSFADDSSFRACIGLSYEQYGDVQYRIAVEYFYSSAGLGTTEARRFLDGFMSHPSGVDRLVYPHFGELGWFRRHYGAFSVDNVELVDHLFFGLYAATNIDSRAYLVSPELTLQLFNNELFIKVKHNWYHATRDRRAYPSMLSFLDKDNEVSIITGLSYSF